MQVVNAIAITWPTCANTCMHMHVQCIHVHVDALYSSKVQNCDPI